MEIEIRKYKPSDFVTCRELWGQLTQHHRDIYGDQRIGGEDPGKAFETYLDNQNLRGPWVAKMGGEVVGFSGLIVQGEDKQLFLGFSSA